MFRLPRAFMMLAALSPAKIEWRALPLNVADASARLPPFFPDKRELFVPLSADLHHRPDHRVGALDDEQDARRGAECAAERREDHGLAGHGLFLSAAMGEELSALCIRTMTVEAAGVAVRGATAGSATAGPLGPRHLNTQTLERFKWRE